MTLIPQHIVLQSPANNDPLLDLNTQPSLDLQFATSKTLDDQVSGFPLVNHQRDASSGKSAGTYVDSNGLIKTSLVNLVRYSEEFDNTAWLKSVTGGTLTVTPNTTLAPNGSLVADTVDASSAISNGRLQQQILGLTVGQSYTASVYVKHLSGNTDFTIWVPGSSAQSPTLTATTEWQRFSLTFTAAATSEFVRFIQFENSSAAEFAVWGAQLEEGSTATDYIPTTSTISGAPRFDHDPDTLESLGLLIEESRTNLITYSEDFNQWPQNTAVTVTLNSGSAPDGSNTANRVQPTTANNRHQVRQSVTTTYTSGATYSLTIYAKAGLNDQILLYFASADFGFARGQFDLTALTATGLGGGTASIEQLPGNWRKLVLTVSATASGTVIPLRIGKDEVFGVGDPSQDYYIWGAQLETDSFPTSYIPTSGSTVTRAADVASITGTNFSSWYNQTAGTLFIDSPDFPNYGRLANSAFVYISDQSVFNLSTYDGIKFGTSSPPTNSRGFITEAAVTQADFIVGSGSSTKFALAATANDATLVADGTAVGTDNTVVMPTGMDRLTVTPYGPGLAHLSRLTYYPYRLADATLQEITS